MWCQTVTFNSSCHGQLAILQTQWSNPQSWDPLSKPPVGPQWGVQWQKSAWHLWATVGEWIPTRGTHGLKLNRPNHVNLPFWQIDPADRPNSYLVSHDLHSSLKSDQRFAAPVNCRFMSQTTSLFKIGLQLDHFCERVHGLRFTVAIKYWYMILSTTPHISNEGLHE